MTCFRYFVRGNEKLMDKNFEKYLIKANTYQTYVYALEPRLISFERVHHWPESSHEIDVFGRCWSLTWTHFNSGQVCIESGLEMISLDGPCAILIPPYSCIDWRIKGGEIYWQALISDLPIQNVSEEVSYLASQDFSKVYLFRRLEQDHMPTSIGQLNQFLKTYYPIRILNKPKKNSAVAEKVRVFLNENMSHEYSIKEMAEYLGFNHSVMDRAFKKAYGLTPVQYRNKMRVLDSAHRFMLGEEKVSDLAFEVGFSGLENFNKQFKKQMRISASHFISPLSGLNK
jgi:AraC-like DNA-binding protein